MLYHEQAVAIIAHTKKHDKGHDFLLKFC